MPWLPLIALTARGDGKILAITMDHDPARLNLTLRDGVVVAVKGG